MTDCPHCKKEIRIPDRAYFNTDTYHKACVTVVECCGRAIRLRPVRTWKIEPYGGQEKEDDWGHKIKAAK